MLIKNGHEKEILGAAKFNNLLGLVGENPNETIDAQIKNLQLNTVSSAGSVEKKEVRLATTSSKASVSVPDKVEE